MFIRKLIFLITLIYISAINHKLFKEVVIFYSYDSLSGLKKEVNLSISDDYTSKDELPSFVGICSGNQINDLKKTVNSNRVSYKGSGFTKRKIYSQNLTYPSRSNVKLKVYRNGKVHNATGTLVSKNKILTSAHVIYNNNKWTDSILVIPAYNYGKPSKKIGYAKSYKYYIFKDYVESKKMGYDLGLLHIEKKLGEDIGYIGIAYNLNISFFLNKNNNFHHFSYPSKSMIKEDKKLYNGDTLYYNFGCFDIYKSKSSNLIRYKQHAPKGESGSSFFYIDENNKPKIYGVLSFSNSTYVLITPKKFYALKNIIKEF